MRQSLYQLKHAAVFFVFTLGFKSVLAATWYVDGSVADDSYDGRSEVYDAQTGHGPKKFIQSAVALAELAYAEGDRNLQVVVLPGTYDSGENYPAGKTSANACASRVVITKPLTLTGKAGKEQTQIVGRYGTISADDADAQNRAYFENLGKDAVRCIYVADTAAGTVIEGFTLRNGATWYNNNTSYETAADQAEKGLDALKHYGGGVCARKANIYVCDCVIQDCWGFYAGLMYMGTAARCKLQNSTVGWKNTSALYETSLSNCILLRNGQTSVTKPYLTRGSGASYLVNCTMAGNQMGVMYLSYQTNYNGVCWGNAIEGCKDETTRHFSYHTVYSKSASTVRIAGGGETCRFEKTGDCFFSSGTDDFRLMEDSPAIGLGDFSNLAKLTADLPERHRLRDFLGNPIMADTNGKINSGAVQTVVSYDELKTGTLMLQLARVDAFGGRPLVYSSDLYATLQVRSDAPSSVVLNCSNWSSTSGYFYTSQPVVAFPDADRGFVFPLPPAGSTYTLTAATGGITSGKLTVRPDGENFTVSVSDTPRPFRGFRINGELDTVPWSTSLSSTTLGGKNVEAVFTSDWYVNPNGDDKKNGMTPALAKKTLQAVMENEAIAAGDTVHAAPGVYNEGAMYGKFTDTAYLKDSDSDCRLPSRVIVPSGVTLIADEGPEKTFIVGHAALNATAPMGLGDGAMRCVLLQNGNAAATRAIVDGFTIVGGRTLNEVNSKGSYKDSDNAGGGVASDKIAAGAAGLVRNCIISNCCARFGGGSYGSRLVNTRVYEVNAIEGAVSFFGYFNGCAFDRIKTDDYILRNFRTEIVGCTFGRELYNASGTVRKTTIGSPNASGVVFCNNLVRIQNNYSANFSTLANCAIAEGSSTNNAGNVAACKLYDERGFQALVDSESRPIVGMEDETISKGGDTAAHNWDLCGAVDTAGASRLSNDSLSIGAYQADWRAQYAKVLCGGKSKVVVTSVSPTVTWTYGTSYLRMHDEDAISIVTKNPPIGPGSLTQNVTGGGLLTVMDGAEVVSPTDNVYTVFSHGNDTLSVMCKADSVGYADIGSLALAKNGLILIFR